MRQLVLEKENSEFKPVKLRLKIDLVSYPARVEGLVNMYLQILDYNHNYIFNVPMQSFFFIQHRSEYTDYPLQTSSPRKKGCPGLKQTFRGEAKVLLLWEEWIISSVSLVQDPLKYAIEVSFGSAGFYGIATIVGYLFLSILLIHIYQIYMIWFGFMVYKLL